MNRFFRVLRFLFAAFFASATAGLIVLVGMYLYITPNLPSVESLKDVQLQTPLRVYARDGALIAEFGEQRRTPIHYDSVPDLMIKAFLAAEDDRFFSHPGVDYQGILRAAVHLVRTGQKAQGGSTITMQVARNFFLSSEKTYLRKINEIFLSLKIEKELSKEEILELYLNKIYLGHRAYGIQAAAQVYYGVNVHELTLPQIAMIAGLPKAPSSYNPITNPERARQRRNYVLGRMHELGFIRDDEYEQALQAPDTALLHGLQVAVDAPYVAEMVRAELVKKFGNQAYTQGYRVYTTLDSQAQNAADRALRDALLDYDARHGYRGAEQHVEDLLKETHDDWDRRLDDVPRYGDIEPGFVIALEPQAAKVYLGNEREVTVDWEGLKWARAYQDVNHRGPPPKTAADILKVGDLIRIRSVTLAAKGKEPAQSRWDLVEIPDVAGALVSLNPRDGSILALTGGFDYFLSKFNRVTQAQRQPGSSFKPFIYSAALEKGFTPASVINDAPVVFDDPALESVWRPENYTGRFYGPTRLREALVHSRNLVSIRLLQSIGIGYTVRYLRRFNITSDMVQKDLSLALGSGSITPLQLATAYAVFANGGFRVEPYFIARIETEEGAVLYQSTPLIACPECEKQDAMLSAEASMKPGQTQVVVANEQETTAKAIKPDNVPADPVEQSSISAGEGTATGEAADTSASQPVMRRAERVITAQNAYLMYSMMRDVVQRGTGRRAMQLGRHDLAGKTGTTNDQRDAWFSGFNTRVVTTAWVGFDKVQPLGARETGGHAALPMWVEYMGEVLKGTPEQYPEEPAGLVTVRIDSATGLLAGPDTADTVFETFPADQVPRQVAQTPVQGGGSLPNQSPEQPMSHPDIIF